MFVLAIWGTVPSPPGSEETLQKMLNDYQHTRDMRHLVELLEAVEGRGNRLTVIFHKLLKHTDLYDDCVQDFFLKARDGLLRVEVKKEVGSYVRQMARYQAYDQLKKLRKHAEVHLLLPPEELPEGVTLSWDPTAGMDRKQFLTLVAELLKPEIWEAVYRVYVLQQDRKQVAEDQGITRATLRGRLERGIGKLRESFNDQFWLFFGAD